MSKDLTEFQKALGIERHSNGLKNLHIQSLCAGLLRVWAVPTPKGRQWYGSVGSFYTPHGWGCPGLGMMMVEVEVPKLHARYLMND